MHLAVGACIRRASEFLRGISCVIACTNLQQFVELAQPAHRLAAHQADLKADGLFSK
jgi:hypothetical protein